MSTPTVAKTQPTPASEKKDPPKKAKPKFITGYKAVNKNLSSVHDSSFKYIVGKEASVTNPGPKGVCGRGIHFSRDFDFPLRFVGVEDEKEFFKDYAMLELKVNAADIIDENKEKARAKKVFVVGLVKKLGLPDYEPLKKRIDKIRENLAQKACKTPEKRLRELFSNFTRRNNLKGFSLKLITSPFEAQWYAGALGHSFRAGHGTDAPNTMESHIENEQLNVFEDSDDYQASETVDWIFYCAASHVDPKKAAKCPKVDSLMEMLEAGAIPLGMNKKEVVWFVPQTDSKNWFPF